MYTLRKLHDPDTDSCVLMTSNECIMIICGFGAHETKQTGQVKKERKKKKITKHLSFATLWRLRLSQHYHKQDDDNRPNTIADTVLTTVKEGQR